MIRGKILGLTIGGITGYLIVSRGFSLVQNCVAYVTDAAKWKAYYKYGVKAEGQNHVQCVVPPGYSSCTRDIGEGKELVVEDPKQVKSKENPEKAENGDASQEDWKAPLANALTNAINDILNGDKGQEEASEGQETASEDGESDEDAAEPSDEEENSAEDDILCPEEFDKAPGDPEPLYHDDLEDGVKVTYETVDQVFEDFNEKPTSGRYSWGKSEKTEKETDNDETLD